MSKHTPGPWHVGPSKLRGSNSPNGAQITTDDGFVVVSMPQKADRSLDTKMADARLIAAAPDLLSALKTAFMYVNDTVIADHPDWQEIHKAIASAEVGE